MPMRDCDIDRTARIRTLDEIVRVDSTAARVVVSSPFETCNREAPAGYQGDTARLYASLKLEGLDDSPVHLAVFADTESGKGNGLSRRTMPETTEYSTVCAVTLMWLAASARGLGMGWGSILDAELQRAGWETRISDAPKIELS